MAEKIQILMGKLTENEEINTSEQKDVVIDALQKLVNDLKDETCRNALIAADISTLCRLLQRVIPATAQTSDGSIDVTLCTECVRCLRNACVQNVENQNSIGHSGAVSSIKDLITNVCTPTAESNETNKTLVRCAVQLAGNLVSGNPDMRSLVWSNLFPQSLISALNYDDMKTSLYCCMLLNECLMDDLHLQQLIKQPEGQQVIEAVLRLCEEESQYDFSLQIMQKLLSTSDFMLATYDNLPTSHKITVLDILAAMLSQAEGPSNSSMPASVSQEESDRRSPGVPIFTLANLAEQFEELAKGVMKLITEEQSRLSTEEMTPTLTLRLLTLLGIATSNHHEYKPLQDRESLLQNALDLLERAHLSGKRSTASPLTPTQLVNHESAATSPVYGLKRDLVRLIGNMCYQHKANQDKVRELQGIPLILEHCNIDDQNPYINQWAIFTIHNLCEGNEENQAFIAGMTKQGAAPSPEFLREAGVEVEMRDGMPYIKTKKK